MYIVLFGTYINANTQKKTHTNTKTHLSLLAQMSGLVWGFHFQSDRVQAFMCKIRFTYADTSNCNRALTCKSFPVPAHCHKVAAQSHRQPFELEYLAGGF